jgi:AcrR family transcriptional regulator
MNLTVPLKTFHNLSEEKQQRICSIAIEEFSRNGFARASINTMVKRLQIAKGSIFQYFGDKNRLFLFAFQTAMDQVKRYLKTTRDNTREEDLFTRLEKILVAGIHFLKRHPTIFRLYLRVMFESAIPFREEVLLSLRRDSHDFLRSLLEQAKVRGEIRDGIDCDRAAFLLDAVMDRFLQARSVPHLDAGLGLFTCDQQTAEKWAVDIVDIIRFGVGAPFPKASQLREPIT